MPRNVCGNDLKLPEVGVVPVLPGQVLDTRKQSTGIKIFEYFSIISPNIIKRLIKLVHEQIVESRLLFSAISRAWVRD